MPEIDRKNSLNSGFIPDYKFYKRLAAVDSPKSLEVESDFVKQVVSSSTSIPTTAPTHTPTR